MDYRIATAQVGNIVGEKKTGGNAMLRNVATNTNVIFLSDGSDRCAGCAGEAGEPSYAAQAGKGGREYAEEYAQTDKNS